MDALLIFTIYVGVVLLAAFLALLLLVLRHLARKGLIARSLNLELLAVRFQPFYQMQQQNQQELNAQQIREKIALMEQFYVNLHGIRENPFRTFLYGQPTFALELTIPHLGEELLFFVAVPKRLTTAVEKVIQGIFPDAHVERSRDYNIFNPDGASVGSYLRLKANPYFPIRTYQKLETDPMKELTNIFTKLAKEGEGAALQVVARPAGKEWNNRLRKRVRYLYEGKSWHENSWLKILNEIVDFFSPLSEESRKRLQEKRLTPLQEEMAKALDGKAGKPLFEVNVRLVASASTYARARGILQGLELSFEQYSDPALNSFASNEEKKKKLRELFFHFSFRSFADRKKIILGTEELTSVFHFPNVPIETPRIRIQKSRQAAPPVELPGEGLLLGYNEFRGDKREVKMLEEDRRRHLYVIGQTGTGKSVFLENMIIQDLQEGRGVCVIDPHGELVGKMLGFVPRHRLQDVVYFDPGDTERPMGLNMLEYDPVFPEQKTFIVNELFSIFQKLYGAVPEALGPMFEQYFRNATMLVMDDPSSGNTLLEISRVMSDKPFRDLKLSRAKNIVVKNFWTQVAEKAGGESELRNMVPYITSKFDVFLANEIMRPIIAQEKSAFNFREIMDSQKIFLVNLSKGRLGDINSSLIGLIIVGKILMAALGRVNVGEEKRKDFYLYIDEFQNVTTDSIATILSEARKYRLDLIITHQFIGQLKEEIKKAVFGNVGSLASFRIGSDDAEFVAKQFKPVFGEQDLLNLDNFNCYLKLLIRGQTTQPFSLKTYPPQKSEATVAQLAREISRTKYGRSREEIEAEIMRRHEVPETEKVFT